jgi:hypothetical protein
MNITVIIFHLGNQEYLQKSIQQAIHFKNIVYLIGDDTNREISNSSLFQHHHFNDLTTNTSSQQFLQNYKHVSPNNELFEKICILRWFAIHKLMEQEKIERAFICDSDVLIYANLEETITKSPATTYANDLYVSTTTTKYGVTAGQSIWTLDKLGDFVKYIVNFYKNDTTAINSDWNYIVRYWNNMNIGNKTSGGISDMYLLRCYLSNKIGFANYKFDFPKWDDTNINTDAFDLTKIQNGTTFDNSIDLCDDIYDRHQWESITREFNVANMENKMKKIQWYNGIPYCVNIKNNTPIRFLSLHFHGCKELINKFINPTPTKEQVAPPILTPPTPPTPPTISAILFSLNDNYTKDGKERLIIALTYMLDSVDEVVYIDWGSPDDISLFDLVKHNFSESACKKVKHLKFTRQQTEEIVASRSGAQTNNKKHFIQQSTIRNIGIRATTSDYIVSTNVDIIFPNRKDLLEIISKNENESKHVFYTINRKNVDMLMTTAIYNNTHTEPDKLRNILSQYVSFRATPNDIDPIGMFKQEAIKQLDPSTSLYQEYVKYARIWNCGDFQMAHRDIWFDIRGFEEGMLDSAMGTDSNLQKKVCNYGYKLEILNKPDVFHMSHPARSSQAKRSNDLDYWFVNFDKSRNNESWGI